MARSVVDECTALPQEADVRDALRHATAPLHAEVDAALPLARPSPTLDDYREHLQLLSDWTDALRRWPVDAARLDAQSAALRVDLAECDRLLGAAAVGQSLPPVDPKSSAITDPTAFGWGVAYVIEGSQLGGQVLFRRLAESLSPHPLGYLQGAGRDTGARWKAFLAELKAHVVTPTQRKAACDGAVAAFALLLRLHHRDGAVA